MKLQIKRLHEDATPPQYAHEADAGMDLFALEETEILPSERKQLRTGLAVAVPDGYVGLVWDKSGVSFRAGIKTLAGVVDAGYRGEVLVVLANLNSSPHTFKKGDKIAQMLIQKIEHPEIVLVDELDETSRGEGGFGSTGK